MKTERVKVSNKRDQWSLDYLKTIINKTVVELVEISSAKIHSLNIEYNLLRK